MLPMRTGAVTVLGYDTYKDRENAPMTRRDGSVVEFVTVQVDGEERVRQIPLNVAVNGSRVDPGSVCELVLETRNEPTARQGRTGPYVAWTEKRSVTAFEAPARR